MFVPVARTRSLRLTVSFTFLLLIIPVSVFAYTSPGKPTGFVNDFAGAISLDQEQVLEAKLVSLSKTTGNEVVVVTIPSIRGDTIENYANKLFQEWGIGKEKTDNGLLILVLTEDHEVRIEVGYGLEGTITDLQSGNIIRKVMIPAFKTDDYAAGISGAVDAVTDVITGSADAAQYSEPEKKSSSNFGDLWQVIFFFGIVILNVLARILGRTKSWWLGGVIGSVVGVIAGIIWGFFPIGIIVIVVLTILGLAFDAIVSKYPMGPGGKGGWPMIFMGGGSNGGFGGGGFGGFGGGSSGGGGASGKW